MKVSNVEIAQEIEKRGGEQFKKDLCSSLHELDETINAAQKAIHDAYHKEKNTAYAVCIVDHATVCFSYAGGDIISAIVSGTGQGIKKLCDLMPAWFQAHYEVSRDGESVTRTAE